MQAHRSLPRRSADRAGQCLKGRADRHAPRAVRAARNLRHDARFLLHCCCLAWLKACRDFTLDRVRVTERTVPRTAVAGRYSPASRETSRSLLAIKSEALMSLMNGFAFRTAIDRMSATGVSASARIMRAASAGQSRYARRRCAKLGSRPSLLR